MINRRGITSRTSLPELRFAGSTLPCKLRLRAGEANTSPARRQPGGSENERLVSFPGRDVRESKRPDNAVPEKHLPARSTLPFKLRLAEGELSRSWCRAGLRERRKSARSSRHGASGGSSVSTADGSAIDRVYLPR